MPVGNAQSTLAAHARAKDCNAGGHNSKPPLNFSTHVLYNKAFRRDAGVKHGHDRIEPPRTTGARCNRGHASSLDAVSQAAGRKQRSLVLAVEIDHGPAAAGLRRFVDFAGMAVDIDHRPIWAAGRADNWNHREPVAEDGSRWQKRVSFCELYAIATQGHSPVPCSPAIAEDHPPCVAVGIRRQTR